MIWTVLFMVAVTVLGCVLFSVHDWGRPMGNRGRRTRMRRTAGSGELRGVPSAARIGGVDMGKYGEFHSRHGIVHGKYLPPAYLRDRPVGEPMRRFSRGYPVMSPEEFLDMVGRS